MSKKSLKKQVLESIVENEGILRGDVQQKFKGVPVLAELDELFFKDKAYALSSDGGCFPCMNAKDLLKKMR